ncbi:putative tctex-1 family protein [Lyophyllum shimeji]|uniref:Tctex-1 family protein n=1 Tax=Lyophyllum shimeji TaxID=47721 RepID=A0A9P3UHC1_LYOSH|nr:putative tctex-1 family protein [Lyophyllum shimeji]
MANSSGLRSPPPSRSNAASPRQKFDADLLKAYMKKLLSTTLQNSSWPDQKDRERVRGWIKEIGERVKERMVEIQPRGFKYIVLTQINENLGQGGRADMVCHWEDTDVVAQEMYANDTLICICIALAIS